jgi:hypothetical protein
MGKELLPNVDGHSFPARGIARSARLADDRAGMRSDRQIGVDTAEDHDLIRAMVIWRPPSAKAPPNPEGIRDDDATTLGENALDTSSCAERLARSSHSDEAEAVMAWAIS